LIKSGPIQTQPFRSLVNIDLKMIRKHQIGMGQNRIEDGLFVGV
jgi:hypothetical protein